MILLIAFRNLCANLRHTLIITFLMTLIVTLFFIGNTALSASNDGLKRTYVHNYTGDVVVHEKTDVPMSVFGATTPAISGFFPIPLLSDYNDCLLYTSPSPRDRTRSRMPSSA